MNFGLEAKVGVFVVGCLLLISAMSLRLVDFSFQQSDGKHIKAILKDAAGLTKDSPVIFSGVEVGKVGEIKLENGKAVADLIISDDYELPGNLKIMIRSKGFLGEKYAELKVLGADVTSQLQSGDLIKESGEITDFDQLGNKIGDIADDVKAITASLRQVLATEKARDDMTTTMTNIRDISDTVNALVQNNNKQIDAIIKNMDVITAKISEITVANAENINSIVANINDITKDLKAQTPLIAENLRVVTDSLKKDGPSIASNVRNITNDIDEVMSEQKDNLKKAIENIAVVTGKLEQTVDNLNSITGKVDKGTGTLGKLVNEDETVDNLNGALTSLKDTLGAINKFKVDISFMAESFNDRDSTEGSMNIKITPGRKRFYLLGLSTSPEGTTEVTNTTVDRDYTDASTGYSDYAYTEEKEETNPDEMLWTLQYAHRFWEDFFFRVGLKDSEAGIGIDYHPFDGEKEDKLIVSFDAYDFPGSDDDYETHAKFGVKYVFYENLFMTAGYDDFLNEDNDSWFVGAGVQFRDDDLKYLLSSTPMPK